MHLVFTSVAKKAQAAKMAKSLVRSSLAACVSLSPIESVYSWKNEMIHAREYLLEIKTANPAAVRAWLAKHHPYRLPMIYSQKTTAVESRYAKWVKSAHKR